MSVTTLQSSSTPEATPNRPRPARPLRARPANVTERQPPLAQAQAQVLQNHHVPTHLESTAAGSHLAVKKRATSPRYHPRTPLHDTPVPDPSALCCSIVQAAVEVLRGIRPLTQLARWLSPEVYEALARRREVTTAGGVPSSTMQARIRRARVVRVDETAAEATVIVQDHHRVRAAAIRIEHLRGSWRVVAFELG